MEIPDSSAPREVLQRALYAAFERWMDLCTLTARGDGVAAQELEQELNWLRSRRDLLIARSTPEHLRQIIVDIREAETWVHQGLRARMHAVARPASREAAGTLTTVKPPASGAKVTAQGCALASALLCSSKYQHCAVFCPAAMPPANHFKRALQAGQAQIGLWSTLPSSYVSELIAGAGFDWLLLDTEHTPSDVPQMLQQLQAVAAARPREGLGCSHAVVRPAWNDKVLIKRYLDIGVQTLLLPFVQNADEARAAVEAVRYAPQGIRGMGGSMRASNFGRDAEYVAHAADEICLLVQVETGEALDNLEAIAKVDGIDGVFIGPADLSASLGYPGNATHPEVEATIDRALATIRACGKAPGILAVNPERAQACLDAGALFVAVGMDMMLLRQGADALATRFKRAMASQAGAPAQGGAPAVSASMY